MTFLIFFITSGKYFLQQIKKENTFLEIKLNFFLNEK